MPQLLTRLFGSRNERLLRTYHRPVREANAFEPKMQALSDAELAAKTPEFRARLKAGERLDDLLPEAFAVVREAALLPFSEMKHEILSRITEWRDGPPSDDMSLVLLEVL